MKMFPKLDDESINHFLGQMSLSNYPKNSMIFDHGDIGDQFYVILEGKASVMLPQEIFVDMNEVINNSV